MVGTSTLRNFFAPRGCFLEPPLDIHRAVDLLEAAVDGLTYGDKESAAALISQADDPEIWEYAIQLMGPV